jgi:hypothetical protein
MTDYFFDTIAGALEEVGIKATNEQIQIIADAVQISHDNYGMAHGYDCIPNPAVSEINKLKREFEKQREKHEVFLGKIKKEYAYNHHVRPEDVTINPDGSFGVWR